MATRLRSVGWSYRLGRAARRGLRGYTRSEQQMAGWLASIGLPQELAWGAVWVVRLALVAVLLYAASWVALLLLFGIAAAWVAQRSHWYVDEGSEWRNGPAGFGLYSFDGYRIDPHVADEDS